MGPEFLESETMRKPVPPKIKKFPAAKQRLLDELLERNTEGTLTHSERARLVQLVAEAEQLMVVNAKVLARFSRVEHASVPVEAVPVTVWVKPEHAER